MTPSVVEDLNLPTLSGMTKLTRYQPAAAGLPWPCASNGFFKTLIADSSARAAASDGSSPARYFTPNLHKSIESSSTKRSISLVTSSAVWASVLPANHDSTIRARQND